MMKLIEETLIDVSSSTSKFVASTQVKMVVVVVVVRECEYKE
jgi:hypothetical protein